MVAVASRLLHSVGDSPDTPTHANMLEQTGRSGYFDLPKSVLKPGHLYGAALPLLVAHTDERERSIIFKSAHVTSLPKGVHIVQYKLLDARETTGRILLGSYLDGGKDDYRKYSDHSHASVVIHAAETAAYYPVVIFRVSEVPSTYAWMSGSDITYRVGGRTYQQVLTWKVAIGNPPGSQP